MYKDKNGTKWKVVKLDDKKRLLQEIIVTDSEEYNWRRINARPETTRQAISTLYAAAPFHRARVYIEGVTLTPYYYEYKNGKVRRIKEL